MNVHMHMITSVSDSQKQFWELTAYSLFRMKIEILAIDFVWNDANFSKTSFLIGSQTFEGQLKAPESRKAILTGIHSYLYGNTQK